MVRSYQVTVIGSTYGDFYDAAQRGLAELEGRAIAEHAAIRITGHTYVTEIMAGEVWTAKVEASWA